MLADAVVLGVGSVPSVPEPLRDLVSDPDTLALHSADFLTHRAALVAAESVTVVGSGQSGAEVVLDLLRARSTVDGLRWLARTLAFAPMEYSKLGLEQFTPDYTAYFHGLPSAVRDRLLPTQWQLYKGIDAETIAAIHDELYRRSIGGGWPAAVLSPGVEVVSASTVDGQVDLGLRHAQQGRNGTVRTAAVVAATGYTETPTGPLLAGLGDAVHRDDRGRLRGRRRPPRRPRRAGAAVRAERRTAHARAGRPRPRPGRLAGGRDPQRRVRQDRARAARPHRLHHVRPGGQVSIDEAAAWRAAGALITHKMLGELSYEHMLEPVADGDSYRLELPDDVVYTFQARRGAFDAWTVVAGSAHRSGEPTTDPRTLVVDARKTLGLSGLRLADVLAELTATVANEAARLRRAPTAAELSALDYNVADGHLTGHPRLVLNKGRVGFSALDRARYAPEAGADVRLRWFAVHPEHAEFRCVDELSRDALLAAELGDLRAEFAYRAPDGYVWVPVHPWQADEILGTLYAAELATGVMIDLGESADGYRAHQTVRTLANVSTPGRHDVKTAVSVRNTLVYRGLNSAATLAGPSVTSWLRRVSAGDPLLAGKYRFGLLGEVASVSVKHPLFGHLEELPYRFHETLGALWREPLTAHLAAGERAISFAALPYRGPDGVSVLAHLIGDGDPEAWLTRLFDLTLTPLLQWLLRHGVGFCPHGQNLILVVDAMRRAAAGADQGLRAGRRPARRAARKLRKPPARGGRRHAALAGAPARAVAVQLGVLRAVPVLG